MHRKSDTNDVSEGTKAPSPGKGLIAVSGSQAAGLKLEGAGQDALSVNTWSRAADFLVLFFFLLLCGWVCTHTDTHIHELWLHLRGTFWDVISKRLDGNGSIWRSH